MSLYLLSYVYLPYIKKKYGDLKTLKLSIQRTFPFKDPIASKVWFKMYVCSCSFRVDNKLQQKLLTVYDVRITTKLPPPPPRHALRPKIYNLTKGVVLICQIPGLSGSNLRVHTSQQLMTPPTKAHSEHFDKIKV